MLNNLIDYIAFQARTRPGFLFARDEVSDLDYAAAWRRARQIGARLAAESLGFEDRVGILGKNGVDNLLLFLGCATVGVVPVAINYRLTATEIAQIADDAEIKALFHDAEFAEILDDSLRALPRVCSFGEMDGVPGMDKWLADIEPVTPRQAEATDVVVQMYTSGTTGVPKGALLTHGGLVTNAFQAAVSHGFPVRAGDKGLMIAPSFHAVGLAGALWTLMFGGGLIIHRDFNPQAMVETIAAEGIVAMAAVPVMLQFALMVPDIGNYDFSSLQLISYGGSPLAPSLLKQCVDVFGCDFAQGYGQTEATTAITFLTPADHRRAMEEKPELLTSCGKPVIGTELKIIGDNGETLPAGEVGEILVRGPQLMKGYWKREEATAATLKDGWLHTGDAGLIDDEGYLYIKDRVKDMIISGGENVYPAELEKVLLAHPDIADAAVIGVADDKWGEVPLAVLVAQDGNQLDIDALTAFCKDKLAGFKIPKKLAYVDMLPRNPSGKILKKILREQFAG